ncbi:MAG: hypothetical protein JWM30_2000 [Burkholderia sp.]|nr:hypothetical protein [Burkholderia sp.]
MQKIGMMQPYLFPYLGYFQLISAVDMFVLGDNLQYVKESWINRNRMLEHGKPFLFSFPLKKSSHLSLINEKLFLDDYLLDRAALLKRISHCYAKAPAYRDFFPLLEDIMDFREERLAKFAENSIRKICNYLEIRTPILIASDLDIEKTNDKQDRVIVTMKKLKGDMYVNPSGGRTLYDAAYFNHHGLALRFHQMDDIYYRQHGNDFVPSLSIIDVLMFNSRRTAREMLNAYSLHGEQENDASITEAGMARMHCKA